MIKKLFLCAALVGAVGLTSCVDDVESASVTEIRNAKAEQLKAAAALDKANADAAIIMANAQQKIAETGAAAQQAEAELLKAKAAYEQAQAAWLAAQTEIAKADAAVALEQAQVELETAKATLEKTKAEVQAWIAYYETEAIKNQKLLEEYKLALQDVAEKYASEKIKTLVASYNKALGDLMALQQALNKANYDLASAKAGLKTWDETLQNNIATANDGIEKWKNNIEQLDAQMAIYQSADYQDAASKLSGLQEQKVALTTDLRNANQDLLPLAQAADAYNNNKTINNYKNAAQDLKSVGVVTSEKKAQVALISSTYYNPWSGDMVNTPVDMQGKWCIVEITTNAGGSVYAYTPLFTNDFGVTTANYNVNFGTGADRYNQNFNVSIPKLPYAQLINGGADKLNAIFAEAVAEKQALATNAETNLGAAETKQTTLNTKWDEYVKAAKANYGFAENAPEAIPAQEKYEKALADLKKALKAIGASYEIGTLAKPPYKKNPDGSWWFDAESYYDRAIADIDGQVNNLTNTKNRADQDLARVEANAKSVGKNLETMEGYTAFADAVAEAKKAIDAANEVQNNISNIGSELGLVKAKISTYQSLLNGEGESGRFEVAYTKPTISGQNVTGWTSTTVSESNNIEGINKIISTLQEAKELSQKAIDILKANIAKYEAQIEEGTSDKFEQEQLIADAEQQIAGYEAAIKAQQAEVDALKAQLDAALAAE